MSRKSSTLIVLGGLIPAAVHAARITSDAAAFASTTYDVIVIGGGTGGLAIAGKLAENSSLKIGVVEAGQYLPTDDKLTIPGYFGSSQADPKYDWLLKTAPQPHINNREVALPRGKVLGGTSQLNYMLFGRAAKVEYDAWGSFGNPGWTWDKFLEYSKRSENATSPANTLAANKYAFSYNPSYHGTSGPIQVSFPDYVPEVISPWIDAMANLGVTVPPENAGGQNIGAFTVIQAVGPNFERTSSIAYIGNKDNVYVLVGAQATKITLSPSTSNGLVKATGVEYSSNNAIFNAKVRKEVVVSAGVLQTPQILELSGIGNPKFLSPLNIPVRVNLTGVGENLQEHTLIGMTVKLKPGIDSRNDLQDPTIAAEQYKLYKTSRKGKYVSSISTISYMPFSRFIEKSYLKSLISKLSQDLAAASPTWTPADKVTIPAQQKYLNNDNVGQLEILALPSLGGPAGSTDGYMSLTISMQHPFSRGSVHINSSDPLAAPVIDPRYLTYEFDKKVAIEAVKFVHKLSKTAPLAQWVDSFNHGPATNATDAEIEQYVLDTYGSSFHHVGTTPMLPRNSGGVVDSNLKVYGTSNIRVVDASVIPLHISQHPMASIYAVAEKASDLIKFSL